MESKSSKIPVPLTQHKGITNEVKNNEHEVNEQVVDDESSSSSKQQSNENLFSIKYENLRLLMNRKDQELIELREFANYERDSLESQLREQNEKLSLFVKETKRQEEQLLIINQNQVEKEMMLLDNKDILATEETEKENLVRKKEIIEIKQLKLQLAQCKGDLDLLKKISLHNSILYQNGKFDKLNSDRILKEIKIIDSIS